MMTKDLVVIFTDRRRQEAIAAADTQDSCRKRTCMHDAHQLRHERDSMPPRVGNRKLLSVALMS